MEDGSGVGLYLAKEILRRENEYIKVKSRVGKGVGVYLISSEVKPLQK